LQIIIKITLVASFFLQAAYADELSYFNDGINYWQKGKKN
jgi:hypothetical protein